MHTSQKTVPATRAHHLQENLLTHVAKGREWATPGIEAALHRALTGIDSGLEAASPRIQASLRTIADELAGGVGSVTPRLHERITRITPKTPPPAPDVGAEFGRSGGPSRKPWWICRTRGSRGALWCHTLAPPSPSRGISSPTSTGTGT